MQAKFHDRNFVPKLAAPKSLKLGFELMNGLKAPEDGKMELETSIRELIDFKNLVTINTAKVPPKQILSKF